jgi:hypothetical protein
MHEDLACIEDIIDLSPFSSQVSRQTAPVAWGPSFGIFGDFYPARPPIKSGTAQAALKSVRAAGKSFRLFVISCEPSLRLAAGRSFSAPFLEISTQR